VFGLASGSINLPDTCFTNPMGCTATTSAPTLDPDYLKCVNQTNTSFPQPCKRTFTGVHGGGGSIAFVYCDGSVHRVSASGDIRVLAAMCTIKGSETIQNLP
jgi:hypothetical protein